MENHESTQPQPHAGRQRWGMGTRSETLDAHARLVDAAIACYLRSGVAKTGMADIAAEAKVTRRTVYNYFKSTDEILAAVIRRESDKFWDNMSQQLSGIADLGPYLVEFLLYTLRHAQGTETFGFVFSQDILPLANKLYIGTPAFIDYLAGKLAPRYARLRQAAGGPALPSLQMLCEWYVRIVVSYLATPSILYTSEAELRELFTAMLPAALAMPAPAGSQ